MSSHQTETEYHFRELAAHRDDSDLSKCYFHAVVLKEILEESIQTSGQSLEQLCELQAGRSSASLILECEEIIRRFEQD